jgi:peptide/nickel transport system substrate-binding protein
MKMMLQSLLSRHLLTAACVTVSMSLAGTPLFAAPEQLMIAVDGDVSSLDPSKDSAPLSLGYRLNVFDSLTELDREGAVHPRLAKDWSYSDDLRVWTFNLRDDVKFHDGTELTAEDVVFTAQRILADEKSPVRQFMRLIEKAEAVDKHTVRFTLVQPYGIFDRQMKYLYVMSKKFTEEQGDQGYATRPIGSGPYRFVEWVKDDRLVLEVFPEYWGGEQEVKRATFKPMPAAAGRANALLTGEIDIVPSIPASLLPMLQSAPDVTVGIDTGFRVAFLALDPTRAPFDKPELREAADIAINREAIAQELMRGSGRATGLLIPPSNEGYDASFKPAPYEPERAKELVKQAGYDGTVITIDHPNNNVTMANEVAQAVAGYLTEAGFNVRLNSLEFTAFFPLWVQRKTNNAFLYEYGSSQFHAETVLATMFEKGSRAFRTLDEVDALVKAQRAEPERAKQQEMISKVFEINRQDRMYLPLHDAMQTFGYRSSLEYKPYPDSVVRLYDLN